MNKDQSDEDSDGSVEVHMVGKSTTNYKPIRVEVRVNGKPLSMEVDTGAAVSLISYRKLKQVLPRIKVNKTSVVLRTYTS